MPVWYMALVINGLTFYSGDVYQDKAACDAALIPFTAAIQTLPESAGAAIACSETQANGTPE